MATRRSRGRYRAVSRRLGGCQVAIAWRSRGGYAQEQLTAERMHVGHLAFTCLTGRCLPCQCVCRALSLASPPAAATRRPRGGHGAVTGRWQTVRTAVARGAPRRLRAGRYTALTLPLCARAPRARRRDRPRSVQSPPREIARPRLGGAPPWRLQSRAEIAPPAHAAARTARRHARMPPSRRQRRPRQRPCLTRRRACGRRSRGGRAAVEPAEPCSDGMPG